MTDPNAHGARPEELPPVDDVIHDARESSWHLPPTPPEGHRPIAGQGSDQSAAPSGRAAAAEPHAAPAAHQAPPATTATVHAAPVGHAPTTGHAASASAAGHGAAAAHGTAGAGHGSAAGHGADHDEPALGPVDVELWGAGIVGTAVGLFMAVCFVLAVSGSGAY